MVTIPTPTISCGYTESQLLVYASRTVLGTSIPISGATVRIQQGTSKLELYNKKYLTDLEGRVQLCIPTLKTISVFIQKSDEDFGNGTGIERKIGDNIVLIASRTLLAESKTPPPVPTPSIIPPPTTSKPSCSQLVTTVDSKIIPNSLPSLPTTPFNINLSGIKEICFTDPTNPAFIKILPVGTPGTILLGSLSGSFKLTKDGIAYFDLSKIIDLSKLPSTDTTSLLKIQINNWSYSKIVGIPLTTPTPVTTIPSPTTVCSTFTTQIDSINYPPEITDFNGTFYIYLRGIKEVCKTDQTNPAFIKKIQKGTVGNIKLGDLSSDFYLTDDGIADFDLSKIIKLASLSIPSTTTPSTTTPIPVKEPTTKYFSNVGATMYLIGVSTTSDKGYWSFDLSMGGNERQQITYDAESGTSSINKDWLVETLYKDGRLDASWIPIYKAYKGL